MSNRHGNSRPWAVLVTVATLALAACAHGPEMGGSAESAAAQPASSQAELSDVIALLDQGQATAAQARLEAMSKRDPQDVSARILLESIQRDPTEMLGTANFDYKVKPGETLINLSQRFLGTSLKFYALARYNDIATPAALAAGQPIRIPGEAPEAAARPARAERREQPERESVSAAPESQPTVRPPAPAANPAQVARLRAAGLAALNRGQLDQAVSLLQRAADLAPTNVRVRSDLDRARRIRQTVAAKR